MKGALFTLIRWSWYALGLLLVLFALLVSLGQYYFPRIGDYQPELLASVNARTPFAVEVGRLTGEWTGVAPTLFLRDLRVYARETPEISLIAIPSAELRVDLIQSAVARSVRVRKLVVDSIDIELAEDETGRLSLAGFAAGTNSRFGPYLAAALLAVREVELIHVNVSVDFHRATDISSANAYLRIENYRGLRRLRAEFKDQNNDQAASVVLESRGDPRQAKEFQLQGMITAESLPTQLLASLFARHDFALIPTTVSGELWFGRGETGEWTVQGHLDSPGIELKSNTGETALAIEDLEMGFLGVLSPGQSLEIEFERLSLHWLNQPLVLGQLRLSRDLRESQAALELVARELDLAMLSRLALASDGLPEKLDSALRQLRASGRVRQLHLNLPLNRDRMDQFRLSAALDDLDVSPWRAAPGAVGLSGYVAADARSGYVDLDSKEFNLHFAKVFDHTLGFSLGSGRIGWEVHEQGVTVRSELMRLDGELGQVDGYFLLDLRKDPVQEDTLSIVATLDDAKAVDYEYVLPRIADPRLTEWLKEAILSGRVSDAAFHLHNVISGPKPPRANDFQLTFNIVDARLEFDPRWPTLESVSGSLYLDNGNVIAYARTGSLLGNEFDGVWFKVAQPAAGNPRRLNIAGTVASEIDSVLELFTQTPLREFVDGQLDGWSGSGAVPAKLAIDMLLSADIEADPEAKISVQATVSDGGLRMPRWDLEFNQLQGPVRFDLVSGLRSSGLSADLWGQAVTAKIGRADPIADERPLYIELDGKVDVVLLGKWLEEPMLSFAEGLVDVRLHIDVDAEMTEIHADSNLVGARLMAPEPFAKTAEQSRNLSLAYTATAFDTRVELSLQDTAGAAIHTQADEQFRMAAHIAGDAGIPELPAAGVYVSGSLERAELGEWLDAVERYIESAGQYGSPDVSVLADVFIGEATAGGLVLSDLEIQIRGETGGTGIYIDHPAMRGNVLISDDENLPIQVALEELQIEQFLRQSADAPGVDGSRWPQALDEVDLLDADISIGQLRNGEADLGRWSFALRPLNQSLVISNLLGELRGIEVLGRGESAGASLYWNWEDPGVVSGFDGSLHSEDVGAVFKAWNLPVPTEAEDARVDVALQWSGSPMDFGYDHLDGWGRMSLRKGRLLDVENNPALRFIGVLNFNEILRRLQLNFEDFFKKGLSYNQFRGMVSFDDGHLLIRDDIELKGPSTRFRLSGGADLRANTIDAKLIATLPLGSNLPWLALAGGPAVAVGALMASKIFEDQIGQLSSAVYTVSGSIDSPEVALSQVFDTGEGTKKSAGAIAEAEASKGDAPPARDERVPAPNGPDVSG